MKKLSTIGSILVTLTLLSTMTFVFSVSAQGNNNPNKRHGSPAFVLNILGKKSDWNGQGDYNNPDRHTMFIPENTTEWFELNGITPGTFGNLSAGGSILLWMTSGPEFAVIDGSAFDDGNVSLQIENGKYYVYVAALAKPGGNSTLDGWYYDNEGNACFRLGEIKRIPREKGQPGWVVTTDLFYITWDQLLALGYDPLVLEAYFGSDQVGQSVWIFDFLQFLEDSYGDTDYYFWKLDNNGNKHIQLRFYYVPCSTMNTQRPSPH
ncbi:MAG: hypothetical protein P8X91_00625, partial [Candidatus Bathyarchaeota archaeon]